MSSSLLPDSLQTLIDATVNMNSIYFYASLSITFYE